MRTLAIDTSGDVGVLAVTVSGRTLVESAGGVRARHGETLLPHLELVLARAGIRAADLDLVALGLGPGSFTGVRIGVATAKGLALAHGTTVVGVRSTRILARAAFGSTRVALVDAAKGEIFVAAYEASEGGRLGATLLEETHGPPGEVATLLRDAIRDPRPVLVGSGVALYADVFRAALPSAVLAPPALAAPRGSMLALEAEEALAERGPDDPDTLEPLYVRASDATLSASAGASRERAPR